MSSTSFVLLQQNIFCFQPFEISLSLLLKPNLKQAMICDIGLQIILILAKIFQKHVKLDDKKIIFHFAIVEGGSTGVELATSLHGFVNEDLVRLYLGIKDLVKITLLEARDHILSM